jgi:putative transposase
LKCLTIADDFSHECIDIVVDHGISGTYVTRPMQNGYIESFNGKFRDECLNEHGFTSLAQARDVIAHWRRDYNEVRPHSSCGRIPTAQFAARHRAQLTTAQ